MTAPTTPTPKTAGDLTLAELLAGPVGFQLPQTSLSLKRPDLLWERPDLSLRAQRGNLVGAAGSARTSHSTASHVPSWSSRGA